METDAQWRRDPNPALFGEISLNFVNVSTWRKFYKFGKMTSKEYKEFSMRLVLEKFGKDVDDNESDAILLGNYFVNTFCKNNDEEE